MSTQVAKQPTQEPAAQGGASRPTTTWKVYKDTGRALRLIGAYLDLNQEDVLDLFAQAFEDYWLSLNAADASPGRRKRSD